MHTPRGESLSSDMSDNLCSIINKAIDLCERIKKASQLRFASGELSGLQFDAKTGKFKVSITTPMKVSSIRLQVKDVTFDDIFLVPQAELLLRKKSVIPFGLDYDLHRFSIRSRCNTSSHEGLCRIAIVDAQGRNVNLMYSFGGEQVLENGDSLPTETRELYSHGDYSEIVYGVQFVDRDCQIKVLPYRNRVIIVSEGAISQKDFNDTVRKILMIVGFVAGYCPMNYVFSFEYNDKTGDFGDIEFDGQHIASFDSRFVLIERSLRGEDTRFTGDNIVSLIEKLRDDDLFSDIFYRYCEITQNGIGLSHITCSEVLAAVMESCARYYSRGKKVPPLLSSKILESELLQGLRDSFSEFKSRHPQEDALKYTVIEKRLANVVDHSEGSTKQLQRAFASVNIGLSTDEIKSILQPRNTLLHGSFRFENNYDIDAPDPYILEAESFLYRQVYLVGAYILVSIGFKGSVRDIEKEQIEFLRTGHVSSGPSKLKRIGPAS